VAAQEIAVKPDSAAEHYALEPPPEVAEEISAKAPDELCGNLWKQSPSLFRCGHYQLRHAVLRVGKLSWAHPEKSCLIKGFIDLRLNPCLVETVAKFLIRPAGAKWIFHVDGGGFSGIDSARIFLFDCDGSPHFREDWMKALGAHITFARTVKCKSRLSSQRLEVS